MESTRQKLTPIDDNTWVNPRAFKRGVLVTTEVPEDNSDSFDSKKETEEYNSTTNNSTTNNSTTNNSTTNSSESKHSNHGNAEFDLRAKHFVCIDSKHPTYYPKIPDPAHLANTRILAAKLQSSNYAQMPYIFNSNRSEEVFVPCYVNTQDGTPSAFYINPNLSGFLSNLKRENERCNQFTFDGFTQFHTVFCIYGARLQAIDTRFNTFSLIKHDWAQLLYEGQKIKDIVAPKTLSLYEEMSLKELDQIGNFIDTYTKKNRKKKLDLHLPGLDYILFALQLLINDKIEFNAFTKLINVILKRRDILIERINQVCAKHGVEVKIYSPFENLFGQIPKVTNDNEKQLIESILKKLEFDKSKKDYKEVDLVNLFITKLCTNKVNDVQRVAWETLMTVQKDNIKTFESLFKFANVIPLACASENNNDYETCFIASNTEKQIWLEYDKMLKLFAKSSQNRNHPFKQIFSVSLLDPIVPTAQVNKRPAKPTTPNDNALPNYEGMAYYYTGPHEDALIKFINDNNIVKKMYENVALFSKQSQIGTGTKPDAPLSLKNLLSQNKK